MAKIHVFIRIISPVLRVNLKVLCRFYFYFLVFIFQIAFTTNQQNLSLSNNMEYKLSEKDVKHLKRPFEWRKIKNRSI